MEDFKKTMVMSGYDRHRQFGQVSPAKKGWWTKLNHLWEDHKWTIIGFAIIIFGVVYAFGQYRHGEKMERIDAAARTASANK